MWYLWSLRLKLEAYCVFKCRVKPSIEVIPKIRANEVGPSTNCFTQHIDLQEIQWINWGETGGGHYESEMPSLLMDV